MYHRQLLGSSSIEGHHWVEMPTYLLWCNGFLGCLGQLFDSLGVMSQIAFASDEDDREALTEMEDFGDPLDLDVSFHQSTLNCYCVPSLERYRGNRESR